MVEAGGLEPPSSNGFPQSSTCVSVLLSLAAASRRRPLLAAASAWILGPARRRVRLELSLLNDAASYPAGWAGAAGRLWLGGHRQLVVGSCGLIHRISESMVLGTQIVVHSSLSKPCRPPVVLLFNSTLSGLPRVFFPRSSERVHRPGRCAPAPFEFPVFSTGRTGFSSPLPISAFRTDFLLRSTPFVLATPPATWRARSRRSVPDTQAPRGRRGAWHRHACSHARW